MDFQLVHASDDEIVVWHQEQGHIFGFAVERSVSDLVPAWCRDLPDAAEPAERFKEAALGFARGEARSRKLIG